MAGVGTLVASVLTALPLGAQQITGRVRDSVSGLPVPGAVVSVAGGGAAIQRTITDRDGRFTIGVGSNTRTLTVGSIGFTPRSIPLSDAMRVEESPIEVLLSRTPSTIAPLVSSGQVCPPSPTAVQALRLWDEARSAFLASIVARETSPARMRVLNYHLVKGSVSGTGTPGSGPKYLPRSADNVVLAGAWKEESRVSTTAWIAWRPMDEVLERGFVDPSADSIRMFVPNVEVLLDSLFESTHCFSLSPDSAGLAGIRIGATRNRGRMNEIMGTLWMSRTPLSVRALEYTYVGPDAFVGQQSGGRVTFRTAPNGIVLVDEWLIFHPGLWPVAAGDTAAARAAPTRTLPYTPLVVRGSTLISAEWGDGTRLVRPPIEVTGQVVERGTGAPVAGATISLPPGTIQTVTAPDGGFRFTAVMPEQYVLSVVDSSLRAFGVIRRDASTRINVDTGSAVSVTVAVDRALDVAQELCGMATLERGKGALLLRVVDTAGGPVDAYVAYGFPRPKEEYHPRFGGPTRGGRTAVCGVGADSLRVRASIGDREGVVDLHPTGTSLDTLTITVRPIVPDTTVGALRQPRQEDRPERGETRAFLHDARFTRNTAGGFDTAIARSARYRNRDFRRMVRPASV